MRSSSTPHEHAWRWQERFMAEGGLDQLFARSDVEYDLGLIADAQSVGEIFVMRTQGGDR
jgi:hypothetical protein